MHPIDELFERLSWGSPLEVQQAAIEEARSIQNLWMFVLPGYRKDVWENCARILAEHSDEELEPYLDGMFEWLQDMNWPGAFIIFDRMKRLAEPRRSRRLKAIKARAAKLDDDEWIYYLNELEQAIRSEG